MEDTINDYEVGKNNIAHINSLDKVDNSETNIEDAKKRFDREYLRNTISELFQKYNITADAQKCIELKYDGFNNLDISKKLNLHRGTVSRHLNTDKAKKILQEIRTLAIITTQEKTKLGLQLALEKNLELLENTDPRIRQKSIDLMIKFYSITNPVQKEFSTPTVIDNPKLDDLGL